MLRRCAAPGLRVLRGTSAVIGGNLVLGGCLAQGRGAGPRVLPDARGVCGRADAKGYTRGFEESAGYKKGYAAGEKLAREQAANMNQAAAK